MWLILLDKINQVLTARRAWTGAFIPGEPMATV
jgi:hypothetical protein